MAQPELGDEKVRRLECEVRILKSQITARDQCGSREDEYRERCLRGHECLARETSNRDSRSVRRRIGARSERQRVR